MRNVFTYVRISSTGGLGMVMYSPRSQAVRDAPLVMLKLYCTSEDVFVQRSKTTPDGSPSGCHSLRPCVSTLCTTFNVEPMVPTPVKETFRCPSNSWKGCPAMPKISMPACTAFLTEGSETTTHESNAVGAARAPRVEHTVAANPPLQFCLPHCPSYFLPLGSFSAHPS